MSRDVRVLSLDPVDTGMRSETTGDLTTFTFTSRAESLLKDVELNDLIQVVDIWGDVVFAGHLNQVTVRMIGIHVEYELELSNKLVDTRLS